MDFLSKFVINVTEGIKRNTAKRLLNKAPRADSEIVKKIKDLDAENKELENIINKYS